MAVQVLDTARVVKSLLAIQLYASVDGRQQVQTPHICNWMWNGSQLLSGGDYISATKVRGNNPYARTELVVRTYSVGLLYLQWVMLLVAPKKPWHTSLRAERGLALCGLQDMNRFLTTSL